MCCKASAHQNMLMQDLLGSGVISGAMDTPHNIRNRGIAKSIITGLHCTVGVLTNMTVMNAQHGASSVQSVVVTIILTRCVAVNLSRPLLLADLKEKGEGFTNSLDVFTLCNPKVMTMIVNPQCSCVRGKMPSNISPDFTSCSRMEALCLCGASSTSVLHVHDTLYSITGSTEPHMDESTTRPNMYNGSTMNTLVSRNLKVTLNETRWTSLRNPEKSSETVCLIGYHSTRMPSSRSRTSLLRLQCRSTMTPISP